MNANSSLFAYDILFERSRTSNLPGHVIRMIIFDLDEGHRSIIEIAEIDITEGTTGAELGRFFERSALRIPTLKTENARIASDVDFGRARRLGTRIAKAVEPMLIQFREEIGRVA